MTISRGSSVDAMAVSNLSVSPTIEGNRVALTTPVTTTTRLGVTDPISLQKPSAADCRLSDELVLYLRSRNLFETMDGMRHREFVLSELNKLLQEWIYELAIEEAFSEEEARRAGGKIFTFGSYRLGVVDPEGDIDTLCVAPSFVTRESFFSIFVAKLSQEPMVSKLQAVPDAYTPIIKLKFHNVDLDLLFARLPMQSVSESLTSLEADDLLKNVDEKTARSLNGSRVADLLLSLVPSQENFRNTLRCIKLWAQNRGIYSNVYGYLGGISWALLVARICQLYPNYSVNQLLNRFFRIYMKWNWKNPVLLCVIKEHSSVPGLQSFKVWNPQKNLHDRQHLMPIITPAFPSMNSTHNVTRTTMKVLIEEFKRGYAVVEQIEKQEKDWSSLFEPLNIFADSRHFLVITVMAKSDQAYRKWLGWVRSKVRVLVRHLESIEDLFVRPWPTAYDSSEGEEWPFCSSLFFALYFNVQRSEGGAVSSFDLRHSLQEFIQVVGAWSEGEAHENQYTLQIRHIRRPQLAEYAWTSPALAALTGLPSDPAAVPSCISSSGTTASFAPTTPLSECRSQVHSLQNGSYDRESQKGAESPQWPRHGNKREFDESAAEAPPLKRVCTVGQRNETTSNQLTPPQHQNCPVVHFQH